jgi:hypothetical protein
MVDELLISKDALARRRRDLEVMGGLKGQRPGHWTRALEFLSSASESHYWQFVL